MSITIRGGRALLDAHWSDAPLHIEIDAIDGRGKLVSQTVAETNGPTATVGRSSQDRALVFDATDLLVLPGLVDIHGDTFERIIEPRPRVRFDLDLALRETDRQLVSNGITTAFHGVTWSWEPGLRSREAAIEIMSAIVRLAPALAADNRIHLRHETFDIDAGDEIIAWMNRGVVGCLAFNDHMTGTIKDRHRPEKMAKMIERSGLTAADFDALVERTYARRDEVPASLNRLAAAARAAAVTVLSHDDLSPEQRSWFRERGASIAEFPTTVETARAAVAAGDPIVFGAPNVMRGGSHTGCPSAAEMAGAGLCTILASDYYYPALLAAPFKLAADGVLPLERAWSLVSAGPARALGLDDRGSLLPGHRADIVLIDNTTAGVPIVVATIVDGRLRYLTDPQRLART
jgi:alpha-D-ribose 1-methylphosphonate 5-triphosphate diphosphatase